MTVHPPAIPSRLEKKSTGGARGPRPPAASRGRAVNSTSSTQLELVPEAGSFINYDADTTYVVGFLIRNASSVIQTLRFVPPHGADTPFRLVHQDAIRLAPGLSHQVDVEFSTHTPGDYKDSFAILTEEGGSLVAPLEALYVPALEFPSVVDVGRVENHHVATKSVTFVNRGRKDAEVVLTSSNSALSFSPSTVVAKARGETTVAIKVGRLAVGDHRCTVEVQTAGETTPRVMTVLVKVIDCRSTLLHAATGKEVVSLHFDKVYAGTTTSHRLVVVNGSEQAVSFAFHLTNESIAPESGPFRFDPEQGRLGPREKRTVEVLFRPARSALRKGWTSQEPHHVPASCKFEGLYSLYFVEMEQSHNFHVAGESIETGASLSPTVLDFGLCDLNDHRDVEVEVRNRVTELPLHYAFERVAHFRVDRPVGTVAPGAAWTVRCTFQPRRPGKIRERMTVCFNETVTRTLTLIGHARATCHRPAVVGGVDKLPMDFVARPQPPNVPRPVSAGEARGGAAALAAAAAVDRPRAVDLGMVPGEGLHPPRAPALPLRRLLAGEPGGAAAPGVHVAPATFDIKSLIRRQYPAGPSTPQEARECRRELLPMDLLKVVVPIKVVDFGRVTVGATAVRPFFFFNGTAGSILVTMPVEGGDYTAFCPHAQVIPPGRMAAFEVSLRGTSVRSCQQVLPFTVNHHHRMRLTLQAEIVPVEVALSQEEALLDFSALADEPVARCVVILSNTGNSEARYRWEVPRKVPFALEPAEGVLAPLSRTAAQVTFTPSSGMLQVSCDASLEVVGAVAPKHLRLTGVVAPTRCVWNPSQANVHGEAQIELFRIPVGKEVRRTLTLVNRGADHAYYSFDHLPACLQVAPRRGRVYAGEREDIVLSVQTARVETIQQTIYCHVRGMRRPLAVRIAAQSVTPPLTVVAPERVKGEILFDYGGVYAGMERAQSVFIRNSGDVAGVIQLDVRPYTSYLVRIPPAGKAEVQAAPPDPADAAEGLFHLTLPPQSVEEVQLVYAPRLPCPRDRFYGRWSQVGADDVHPMPPLVLMGEALAPRLLCRPALLVFPPLLLGHPATSLPLTLQNLGPDPARWRLRPRPGTADAVAALVLPSARAGEVPGESSVSLTVSLLAPPCGSWEVVLEWVLAEDETNVCATCTVRAVVSPPRLRCPRTSLVFPATPLGVEVRETILLINEGFERVEVHYEGEVHPPLRVVFPRGHECTPGLPHLPVEVFFGSARPITFHSSILLSTSVGEVVRLTVSGSAVASILATGGLVRLLGSAALITTAAASLHPEDAAPFVLEVHPTGGEPGPGPSLLVRRRSSVPSGIGRTGEAAWRRMRYVAGPVAVRRLTRWMNGHVLRVPVDHLITTMQTSYGGALCDVIQRLFGKRPRRVEAGGAERGGDPRRSHVRLPADGPTGRRVVASSAAATAATAAAAVPAGSLDSPPSARAARRDATYARGLARLETLVGFLQTYGACLGGLPVALLLPYEDYLLHTQHPVTDPGAETREAKETGTEDGEAEAEDAAAVMPPRTAAQFALQADHAWMVVLLETLRLFYLARCTPAAVLARAPGLAEALPGVERWTARDGAAAALELSNVYSPSESFLLHWVRASAGRYLAHSASPLQEEGRPLAPQNFTDLRDARALLATVLLYVPSLQSHVFHAAADRAVVVAPGTVAEHENNAVLLMDLLSTLEVPALPTPKEFLDYSQTELVLFTAVLLAALPGLLPTETIELHGKLLYPMTQTLQVRNPSAVTHQYRVLLDHPEFHVSEPEVIVPPGGTTTVTVSLTPKYPQTVESDCLFVDETAVLPDERRSFAVRLRAVPNTDPLQVFHLETPLYEPLSTEIAVENPFPQDCVVSLTLSQTLVEDAAMDAEAPERAWGRQFPEAFFLSMNLLPLRRKEPTRLPLQFIPLARGDYQLRLTFRDEKEGEFTYEVRGRSTAPRPSDTVAFRAEGEERAPINVPLRAGNAVLERALRVYEERLRRFRHGGATTATTTTTTTAPVVGAELPEMAHLPYRVAFYNEAMEGPHPFFVFPPPGVFTFPEDGAPGQLTFCFCPTYVGRYDGLLLLASAVDVRVVRLTGECVPRGESGLLRFSCPARQSITQAITLMNHAEEDWLITATLEGDGFSGLHELRVPRGKAKSYTLRYSPAWITKEETMGRLQLYNSGTGQNHIYTLVGVAEAPLSEEVLRVECRAREAQVLTLTVPSVVPNDCTFTVETDLPFTEGESTLIVPRASVARYTLTVWPTVGGTYAGRVLFLSGQGRYVWYAVHLHVAPPEKEGVIRMETHVRAAVVAEVAITNPLAKDLFFAVKRVGAGLMGENAIFVEARGRATYPCLFLPTHVGDFVGRLAFCHADVGEFWYELQMTVHDSPPEELHFASALGVPSAMRVKLPNTTDNDYTVAVRSSNPTNFHVHPAVVTLPAHTEVGVEVVYTPTAVGRPQTGTVVLSHPELGQWAYACAGVGHPPAPCETRTCVCEIGSTAGLALVWVNTLEAATRLRLTVTGNAEGYFTLRRAPTGPVEPGAEVVLFLQYAPQTVGQHTARVEVRPEGSPASPPEAETTVWTYPLQGLAEWRELAVPYRFRCEARKQQEGVLLLRAPGLSRGEREGATVTFVPDPNQHYLSAIQSSLTCALVTPAPYPDAFEVTVTFSPLRPIAASGDLLVRGSGGGTWRYRVYLEATPAPPDDTIVMTAAYKERAAVSFDLYNVFPYKSKFVVYFTADSSKDFEVSPAQGVLLPFVTKQHAAAAGTAIRLSYCPSSRVPRVKGTLIVDSEDMQWIFQVVGKQDNQAKSVPRA